jgi:chromosome segregation ATPase
MSHIIYEDPFKKKFKGVDTSRILELEQTVDNLIRDGGLLQDDHTRMMFRIRELESNIKGLKTLNAELESTAKQLKRLNKEMESNFKSEIARIHESHKIQQRQQQQQQQRQRQQQLQQQQEQQRCRVQLVLPELIPSPIPQRKRCKECAKYVETSGRDIVCRHRHAWAGTNNTPDDLWDLEVNTPPEWKEQNKLKQDKLKLV